MSTTYDIERGIETADHRRPTRRDGRRRLFLVLGASVLLSVLALELFVLQAFGIFFPL